MLTSREAILSLPLPTLLVLGGLLFASCAPTRPPATEVVVVDELGVVGAVDEGEPAPANLGEPIGSGCGLGPVAYPANSKVGNHYVDEGGALPGGGVVDVALEGEPRWLVGLGLIEGSYWAVGLENGAVAGVILVGERPRRSGVIATSPLGAPLALAWLEGGPQLLREMATESSPLSHPVLLDGGEVAAVTSSGELLVGGGGEIDSWRVNALPDGRLLDVGRGRLLLFTDPTDEYRHGVLGDGLEGGALTRLDLESRRVLWEVEPPEGAVFEGIAPLWGDMNGDGLAEVLTTVSDSDTGSRYVAYSSTGERLAESEGIGRGNRWRHAIAIAPFGPEGAIELAGVRTPHLGRVVEFLRLEGDRLEPTAELQGFSSHRIGSRNLDMALAGDFDGDGSVELLVPDEEMDRLGAVRRTGASAEEAWSLPLPGKLETNLSVACHEGRALALGAGVEGGLLRLWIPR